MQLVEQISEDYESISTHLKIERRKRNKTRVYGEVDVLARKGKEIHLYEVKCSYRIVKARKQLKRIKKAFKNYKTSCFFYCGDGKQLVELS